MTASGSVSDYEDTGPLQIAISSLLAGVVPPSAINVTISAASVLITATIAVPASTTSTEVQATLSAALPNATAASAALGITVESVPTIVVAAPPPSAPPQVSVRMRLGFRARITVREGASASA